MNLVLFIQMPVELRLLFILASIKSYHEKKQFTAVREKRLIVEQGRASKIWQPFCRGVEVSIFLW